jgi:integrase
VKLPKQRKREVRALSPAEVKALRDAAKGSKHEALWDFLLGTGCRPGEALALQWSDLDLDQGVAKIERTLSRPGGKYEVREPKTAGSARRVWLTPSLVKALREHRARQAARKLKLGEVWQDQGLVFPGATGGFADEMALYRREFQKIRTAAKLPDNVTLYALRHTFATLALVGGASIHEVAAAMGHTGPALVLSTYGHALPEKKAETFTRVGSLVFG